MTLGQVWLDAEKEEVLKLLKVTGNLTKSQKIWKKIILKYKFRKEIK